MKTRRSSGTRFSKLKNENENGMATVSYVLATGLSLIVLTWCTLFIVMSYSRAVIRDSASRAARDGAVTFNNTLDRNQAVSVCQNSFNSFLSQGLPASATASVSSSCSISGDKISVTTSGNLNSLGTSFVPFSINETTSRKFDIQP